MTYFPEVEKDFEKALQETSALGQELVQALSRINELIGIEGDEPADLVERVAKLRHLANRFDSVVAMVLWDKPMTSMGRHQLEAEVRAWRAAYKERP